MKLMWAHASPFARKARAIAIECGISDQVENVEVVARPDQSNPQILTANPLGKIPSLLLDDGQALYDSRVITRYFDQLAGTDFFPAGDWKGDVIEATADGIMDAAVLMVYERRFRSPESVSEDFIGWQWTKIERSLDVLAHHYRDRLNSAVSGCHFAVGAALGYLDFRHSDRDWRTGRESLASLFKEFGSRPSMAATVPHD